MKIAERMAQFRAELAEQGLRITTQRELIAEVFFTSGRHLSLNDISDLVRERRKGVGFATVYRTMRLMVERGLANEHKFGENQTLYEVAEDGEHHDHLICVDCGKIVEFEEPAIEALQDAVARRLGYDVVSHRHEVYVRCVEDCGDPARAGRAAQAGQA